MCYGGFKDSQLRQSQAFAPFNRVDFCPLAPFIQLHNGGIIKKKKKKKIPPLNLAHYLGWIRFERKRW